MGSQIVKGGPEWRALETAAANLTKNAKIAEVFKVRRSDFVDWGRPIDGGFDDFYFDHRRE
jgi:hypothetical protein